MKRHELARLRLANQQLINPSFKSVAKLIDYFGAMNAQHIGQLKWALGSRLPDSKASDVTAAFDSGQVVRSWLFRGGIHLVSTADLSWLLELSRKRIKSVYEKRLSVVGLSALDLLASQDIMFRMLKQNSRVTHSEMMQRLKDDGLNPEGERGYLYLLFAGIEKLIVCGFGEGPDADYRLYEDVVDGTYRLEGEEAMAELALRYFNSRGPAQLQDFAWWAGTSMEDAKAAVEAVAGQLSVINAEGKQYFLSPMSQMPTQASIHLLAGFDEFLLSYRDRDPILDPRKAGEIDPKKNGLLLPMIEINGEIEGTWMLEVSEGQVKIQSHPFRPLLDREMEGVKKAGHRYLQFMTNWQPADQDEQE